MADLPEQETWDGVRQLETSDRALGGPGGVMNEPMRNLTNRTAYLKKTLEGKTGAASTTMAGITKLNSATNSTSESEAATPKAVKVAYDLASSKLSSVPASSTSVSGIVKLNTAINSTATTEAATPSAVKQAYDLASSASGNANNRLSKSANFSDIESVSEALNNLGLLEAAKRDVGIGVNQIPDMSFFASSINGGYGYIMHPSGIIEQYILVTIPSGQRSISASTPIAWPTKCVDIQVTHYGSAAYYGTAIPNSNSTFTIHLQPSTSGGAAAFFVKLTGY